MLKEIIIYEKICGYCGHPLDSNGWPVTNPIVYNTNANILHKGVIEDKKNLLAHGICCLVEEG